MDTPAGFPDKTIPEKAMTDNTTQRQESIVTAISNINADSAALPSGVELEGNVSIERVEIQPRSAVVETADSTAESSATSEPSATKPTAEPVERKRCSTCDTVFNMREVSATFDGTTTKYQCPECGEWQVGPFDMNQGPRSDSESDSGSDSRSE